MVEMIIKYWTSREQNSCIFKFECWFHSQQSPSSEKDGKPTFNKGVGVRGESVNEA